MSHQGTVSGQLTTVAIADAIDGIRSIVDAIRARRRVAETHRVLSSLSDAMLDDIGLKRSGIDDVAKACGTRG